MINGAYFAISESVIADVVKIRLLFLFLPRKEKTKGASEVQVWWSTDGNGYALSTYPAGFYPVG